MKKKFKFKLEAVLKLRRLEEEKCKMEVGRLQVAINKYEDMILDNNESIKISYDSHEEALEKGMSAQELQFHPYFVSGKKAHIDAIQAEIRRLEYEKKRKVEELSMLRGKVKVFEKMREKELSKFKKEANKKEYMELEEQTQNWKMSFK